MRRISMIAIATAAVAFSATAAEAQTVVLNSTCSGNCFTSPLVDNVNLDTSPSTSLGIGHVDGYTIDFTSSTDLLQLTSGAATISTVDGLGFGDLMFSVVGGGFTYADFSLDKATAPITLNFTLSDGTISSVTIADPTGSEPFGIQAAAGTFITSVDMITSVGTYDTFKQLKLGGFGSTAPVPEPATWGMMLLGFAGMGMVIRRSRRRNGALMQVA